MTSAWRKRRSESTGLVEEGPDPRRSGGWRARLGLNPYHRNPAHMLLARPGVIAALLITLALVLRVVEIQRTSYTPVQDGRAYLVLGGQIAHSGDYASEQSGPSQTKLGPSAYYPPAYPYLLGALDAVTGNPPTSSSQVQVDRLAQAVLGALVVGLIGLIALELFGVDMALLAMALAAIYPVMIEMSSILAPEALMTVLMLAAVWAGLRVRHSRDPLRWSIAAGVFTGLAALTDVSAILLVIPLAFAVSRVTPVMGRRQVAGVLVLVASTMLALSPWLIRDGLVMHRFVPITDASGVTLAGTYNASSAHGQPPYAWRYYRQLPEFAGLARQSSHLTETALSSKLQSRALTYIAYHPASLFSAFWHNSLRLLELEGSGAWHESAASVGLPRSTAEIGVFCFWALCLLGLLGSVGRPGMKAPSWLWAVPVLLWLSAALVNGETPQFRMAVEPFLVLLAARGIARASGWIRKRPPAVASRATVTE